MIEPISEVAVLRKEVEDLKLVIAHLLDAHKHHLWRDEITATRKLQYATDKLKKKFLRAAVGRSVDHKRGWGSLGSRAPDRSS